MRREFVQFIAILAIALGAGLFAFGRHLNPAFDSSNPAAVQLSLQVDSDERGIAAVACGLGVCLMTGGVLSIVLPWVNDAIARRRAISDSRTQS